MTGWLHVVRLGHVGFVPPKRSPPLSRANIGFTCQTAGGQNSQSSAAPVLARRGERRAFPSPRSRGENSPSHNVRGAERRKARVTSIRLAAHAQCDGRSPRGAPLRRFSLDPETAFCEQTGAAIRNALDSAGFHPRSSAPTSRVAPTDPRNWAGQCLPRAPEMSVRPIRRRRARSTI